MSVQGMQRAGGGSRWARGLLTFALYTTPIGLIASRMVLERQGVARSDVKGGGWKKDPPPLDGRLLPFLLAGVSLLASGVARRTAVREVVQAGRTVSAAGVTSKKMRESLFELVDRYRGNLTEMGRAFQRQFHTWAIESLRSVFSLGAWRFIIGGVAGGAIIERLFAPRVAESFSWSRVALGAIITAVGGGIYGVVSKTAADLGPTRDKLKTPSFDSKSLAEFGVLLFAGSGIGLIVQEVLGRFR